MQSRWGCVISLISTKSGTPITSIPAASAAIIPFLESSRINVSSFLRLYSSIALLNISGLGLARVTWSPHTNLSKYLSKPADLRENSTSGSY